MAVMQRIGSSIARGTFTITTSDVADLPKKAEGVYVGGAGTLHYIGDDGEEDTVTLSAGQIWPVRIVKVFTAGTSATNLKGFVLIYDNY
jgi:hypothetical protein